MICENCKQRIDSYAHGLKCERGSFAERVNEIRSENTSGVTFAAAFTAEPACKVSDPTTEAIKTITEERERLRRVISVLEDEKREQGTALAVARRERNAKQGIIDECTRSLDNANVWHAPPAMRIDTLAKERDELRSTVQGMKDAIAPAVIEQAARNECAAFAARDVALERADRITKERDHFAAEMRANHVTINEQKRTIDRMANDLKSAYAYQTRTQTALEGFVSACADQTVQIMELRSALREVKPDHPMFNGSGSARAGDATPG